MTLIKNAYTHPYAPTVGLVLAPGEIGDRDVSYPQEQDAINTGGLIVVDPDYVPPPSPPTPLTGTWRPPVAQTGDLEVVGNQRGDVRLVIDDDVGGTVARYWDGNSWEALSDIGGGGGVDMATLLTALGDVVEDPVTGWPDRPTLNGDPIPWPLRWRSLPGSTNNPVDLMAEFDIFLPVPEVP